MVHGFWPMVHEKFRWCTDSGTMVHEHFLMVHGFWQMVHEHFSMVHGFWPMVHGYPCSGARILVTLGGRGVDESRWKWIIFVSSHSRVIRLITVLYIEVPLALQRPEVVTDKLSSRLFAKFLMLSRVSFSTKKKTHSFKVAWWSKQPNAKDAVRSIL